ncbi:NAD(P)-binding domain-containing protein [Agromyces sp. NPDC049794]|uniref:NAD(P)-dependent oxidoreductase n=1 Tax=unclassified Agromyces TaxID=2639701 RepID=UPI0033D8C6B7
MTLSESTDQTSTATSASSTTRPTVALLGLGPMGLTLARTLAFSGLDVRVWSRTPGRADDVEGIDEVRSVAAAVDGADLVVASLRDHDAFRIAFEPVEASALTGTIVVNTSSATPAEARRTAEWAAARDIRYLSSAVMVPTPVIGTEQSLLLFSGGGDDFDAVAPALAALGRLEYLGDDHGAASLLDVSMLEVFFAGMTSFLHAAAMLTANGRTAAEFVPWATSMLEALGGTFVGLARDVDAERYPGDEDRLSMDLAALQHIVDASDEIGLDGGVARAMRDLAARWVAAGFGDDSFSRVIESVRTPPVG